MSKIQSMLLLVALATVGVARVQTPTGIITGVVTDATGAAVAVARIIVTNRATGLSRTLTTSAEGNYSAVALPPGDFQVTVEATGFRLVERTATVEAGTATTVNLQIQVGGITVPVLGAGASFPPRFGNIRVTVDGANIVAIGNVDAILQISQEVVQEFQLSTVNFDLSTGLTTSGAINIVTRSGGKEFHGSGFYFYRDHNLAAYPGLQRDRTTPTHSSGGASSAIISAAPSRVTAPSSSPATSATTKRVSSQFSRTLPNLSRSEESFPVLFSAINSTFASTLV
jgi:hypothetical protein